MEGKAQTVMVVSVSIFVKVCYDLPVVYLCLPRHIPTSADNDFEELLNVSSPILDPLRLSTNCESTAGALSLERTDFVGTYAFRKPHGSGGRNYFA